MLTEEVGAFVSENRQAVLSTFRGNGAAQMSIVLCGPYDGGVAFTTPADRAKLANLKRDPRCSLLVSQRDWWGYVVLEGHARLMSPESTDGEELRLALRDVFRVAAGEEHPDWEEYDRSVSDERRSVVVVVPERVYGTAP